MMASRSSRAFDGEISCARIRAIKRSTAAKPAEVHRPGLHDVQRAGRRRRRPTVRGDVDRRVDDVDLTALDAIGGGDGRHLIHRGGRRHSGRHQDGADGPGEIEHLAHPRVVGVVALPALRFRDPRQAVGRRICFPNDSAQDLALTCSPRLARTITGQLHSTSLLTSTTAGCNAQAPTDVPYVGPKLLVFSLTSSEQGSICRPHDVELRANCTVMVKSAAHESSWLDADVTTQSDEVGCQHQVDTFVPVPIR